jgi:hypothetical protein
MNSINTAAEGGDMRGAFGFLSKERGPWGKHGFPHGASPKSEAS